MNNLEIIKNYPMQLQVTLIKTFYYKNYKLKNKQKEIHIYQNWMIQHNINYLEPYKEVTKPKSTISNVLKYI